MPPALSDHSDQESSGDEQVPAQKSRSQTPAQPESDHGEQQAEEAAEEYVVEKILGHRFVKGQLQFDVKWQGYDNPSDQTWEPESNMDGAFDVIQEYFEEIGGRPEPKGQKRKGRQSGVASESGTPASSVKRAKQEKQWSPPPGSWEYEVSHVDTVEEIMDPKTGGRERFAYLVWNNQKKTQHPLKHVYKKCPQKMLVYYESHLIFTPNNDEQNGDTNGSNAVMKDAY